MSTTALSLSLLLSIAAAPPAAPTKSTEHGPLDFRCDAMRMLSKPNRTLCENNVVLRRGTLLLCCEQFEGEADSQWTWSKFFCRGDVRAWRGDEFIWADVAEFVVQNDDLILTGRPILKRGESTLEGERIVVDVQDDQAQIQKPKGRLQTQQDNGQGAVAQAPAKKPNTKGPLPGTCPLPAFPNR